MLKTGDVQKEKYLQAFLFALGLSVLVFLPFVIIDKGYFFFFGDFNVQQIPFYKLAHEAVRSGDVFWSWYTDLGANFIASYSFYLLGSPFFWLTIPFPTSWVPYFMAPLFCLKFATASFTAYAYITKFVKNKNYALLGALLYAFSGFSVYNIFFNHFHECIAFFPLLLLGLEEYMRSGRRGLFAVAVAINAFINYFFFFGEVVFLIIYFVFRVRKGGYTLKLKGFLTLGIEAVIGFALAAVLLLPAITAILDNPRVARFPSGWWALLYGDEQRYPQIIQSFFFPPEIPSRPNFFPDANVKWSSVAGWLPFVSMSGAISFMAAKKKLRFLNNIIYTCLVFAMVPILNSAFYAFNSAYYARWFYMPVLILALMSALAFEDEEIDIRKGMRITGNISIIIVLVIGLMPVLDGTKITGLGLEKYSDRFIMYSALVLLCIIGMAFLYNAFHNKREAYQKALLIAVSATIAVYSWLYIGLGKTHSNTHDYIVNTALNARDSFFLPKDEDIKNQFYRIDLYNGMDNQAMFWHMPSIQAFHSIVPGSVMEFYPSVGVQRDVGSRPETTHWGLRHLLSVKFLFVNIESDKNFNKNGYEYLDTQNGYEIYRNLNYIPMGFTYDYYMTQEDYDLLNKDNREDAMIGAVLLSGDQINRYAYMLDKMEFTYLNSLNYGTVQPEIDRRKASAAYYFQHDNKGFSAQINTASPELVFFSVPYEEGWTAKVNGRSVPVEKVNVGFMAVAVGTGESEIRFEYRTPGLAMGAIISAAAALLLALYLLYVRRDDRKNRALQTLPGEQDKLWPEDMFNNTDMTYIAPENVSPEKGEEDTLPEITEVPEAEDKPEN
ncbi:MAG: YfhO family protein [Oscillospiraceae bacterium]|nr:YfhO family protein [Oscillospiraceae bacterium]